MTDQFNPDDDLTPAEKRRMLGEVPADAGTALRMATAIAAADAPAAQAVIDEIVASGRAMYIIPALAVISCRLAHALVTTAGGDAQTWLDAAALTVLDEVDKSLEREAE